MDKDVYINPPPDTENINKVWKLKKSLYGLKQSARNWFNHLKSILLMFELEQVNFDPGVFVNN